jgi:SAM-dependent methyltransferase/uncharacterized protein YbaR (Trm112 family)
VCPIVTERAARAPAAGHAFAPAPAFGSRSPLASRLQALAGPAAPERNREVEVEEGLLICGECARPFPITGTLPELLPDHLRDPARERELLDRLARTLPDDVRSMLRPVPSNATADDPGAHYKKAEIGIVSRLEDPTDFFGPGYTAPFNHGNTEFTIYLIKLFANVVTLLDLQKGSVVVDSGCGYAWTSEWLWKSGVDVIGVDICRAYLEIGLKRIGPARPNLVVADVEHLPIAGECSDAVFAFESFHHLPDRVKAMAGYARALKNGGSVVLAEPGKAHETADVSVETMNRFGILEKGMELEDVEEYAAGSPFDPPVQHQVLVTATEDLERGVYLPSLWRHNVFHGNIFRIRKNVHVTARRSPIPTLHLRMSPGPPGAANGPLTDGPAAALHEFKRTHERLAGEWHAEIARTAAELAAVKRDLVAERLTVDDMRRSAFWKARRLWVRLAALFGSNRGDLPPDSQRHA